MNGTERCSHSFGQYTKWWTLLYFLLMLHCFWCHCYFVCHRVPLDDHRLTDWKPPPQDHKLGKPIIATSWTAWVTHVDAIEGLIFWSAWLKSSHSLSLHTPDFHPCLLNPSLDQTLQHIQLHKLPTERNVSDATACRTGDSFLKWTHLFRCKKITHFIGGSL